MITLRHSIFPFLRSKEIFFRRRADLKQIHHDLRLYLKSVQNCMVELINDDYAHFVNLSSNLVALKESIDKIDNNIEVNSFYRVLR